MRLSKTIKYVFLLIFTANLMSCALIKPPPKYEPIDATKVADFQFMRLASRDTNIKLDAVIVLGMIGEEAKIAVPDLIHMLNDMTMVKSFSVEHDPDYINSIAQAAAWSLGRIKDRRAVTPLLAVLKEEEYNLLNKHIITALANIGDRRAAEPLAVLIEMRSKHSAEAAEALGKIGDPDPHAVRVLIDALKYNDRDTRVEAKKALVSITGKDFGSDRGKWLSWWEENK